MSGDSFTFRVKIGDCEIELRGPREEVIQALDALPRMVKQIREAFKVSLRSPSPQPTPSSTVDEPFPVLHASPDSSCPDAIVALLATSWGRQKPRYLREILDAMKMNALHYPLGTVKGRLTDLTKKGVLRRIKGEKGYGYVVTK